MKKSGFLAVILAVSVVCSLFTAGLGASAEAVILSSTTANSSKNLKLWYDKPAPDNDTGWIDHSIPMGNGYMGVNLFGGTDKERIQITENSTQDSNSNIGGLNNFAEVYIDFNHNGATNYMRDLVLNEGVAHVQYDYNGVHYKREFFTSYPDKVMAIRLSASQEGELSFTLRPTIPYLTEYREKPGDNRGKSGTVKAEGDMITLSGAMEYYNLQFEGQFKVIPDGGTMQAQNDPSNNNGTITVSDANSAVILIAVGTNFEFNSQVVSASNRLDKLKGFAHPHAKVTQYLTNAAAKSFDELLASHQEDYLGLYDRVNFDLGAEEPSIPTDKLVDDYRNGIYSPYLEELVFQFGRYLLICSSRDNTLPPNLQGIWNVYQDPPWRSGYWHNVNLQMNYWLAFSTNMPELFESYIDYFNVYLPRQQQYATQYINQYNKSQLDPGGDNGWSMGNSAWPYNGSGKSSHSGFGTGAWTAMLFWDYYDFTRDEQLLKDVVYPAIYGQANFLSRFVREYDGYLLANPSSSPENADSLQTIGTTFDQQTIYENHRNTLKAAEILGYSNDVLDKLNSQLPRLDPIVIGKSGQIKEYREEEYYGDIGEYNHRHISQLLGVFPGQLINTSTPAWLDAAKVSLAERGPGGTGWAEAERIATWARTLDGEQAYFYYNYLIKRHSMHNLFNNHRDSYTNRLFQVDGNLGASAGVSEMLLQSNEYAVAPLPAMPAAWANGSYRGLLARGNFEVSASWSGGQADRFEILSKSGGPLKVRYADIKDAIVTTSGGREVSFTVENRDQISFETTKGETYSITSIPAKTKIAAPSALTKEYFSADTIKLDWTASKDAVSYNVYRAVESAPEYELIASNVNGTFFTYQSPDLEQVEQCTFRVTAVAANGRESDGITTLMLQPIKPDNVQGYLLEGNHLQIWFDEVDGADSYNVYKKTGDNYELVLNSPYNVIVVENASADYEYAVSAGSARESGKSPVTIVPNLVVDNVFLNKPVTASKEPHSAPYTFDKMVDGDTSSRMATRDSTSLPCILVTEIDLEGVFALGEMTIYEFLASGETGTRSDQTTVELYNDGSWYTVIDKKSLNTDGTKKTTFNLQQNIGSKVRITWVNNRTTKGQTIYEVMAAGTKKPADKKELFHALGKADQVDTTPLDPADPAVIAFTEAKQTAVNALKKLAASQAEVDAASASLEAALAELDQGEEGPVQALLSGEPSVAAGSLFDLIYGLANVKEGITAQDITFNYDPDKIEFISAKSVKTGIQIVGRKEAPGQVRIIAASLGSGESVIDDGDVLMLTWKAKELAESAQTSIALSSAVVSDGSGVETQIEAAAHHIAIEFAGVVDKTALNRIIANAQDTHDAATEGSGIGQYPAGSKAALQAAIDAAKAVADDSAASQQQVDQAAAALSDALDAFVASMITEVPGDLNGDGKVTIGDLAIAARCYGKSSLDQDWDLYKFADLNDDGKVDIADLVMIAGLIL